MRIPGAMIYGALYCGSIGYAALWWLHAHGPAPAPLAFIRQLIHTY